MAYEFNVGLMASETSHNAVVQALSTFLQANGWTLDGEQYSSTSSYYLVMHSSSDLYFRITASGSLATNIQVGTGWTGTLTDDLINHGSGGYVNFDYITEAQDVYFVTTGGSFYVLGHLPGHYNDGFYQFEPFSYGVGRLSKIGTYAGDGSFVAAGKYVGCFDYKADDASQSGWWYHVIMTGDVGGYGVDPYLYSRGRDSDWKVQASVIQNHSAFSDLTGLSVSSRLSPIYAKVYDPLEGYYRVIGTYADVLIGPLKGVHKTGDIIDYNGSQYLCYSSLRRVTNSSRDDYTDQYFKVS